MFPASFRRYLLVAGLTAAAIPLQACAKSDGSFSAEQQKEIGAIAAKYLVDHPEVLQQASQQLQLKQQEQATSDLRQQAIQQADALLNDEKTPAYGPKDARVAVVEFFDYQCIYCAHTAPEIEKTMRAHPEARYVFKEFPVFGQRWSASTQAALDGLTIYKDKGAKAYLAYHNGIYATGKNEGDLKESDVAAVAARSGISKEQLKANHDAARIWINNTMELAQQLGVMGTPTLIVMPTKGATADNVTVIPGAADQASLDQAIKKAAGK